MKLGLSPSRVEDVVTEFLGHGCVCPRMMETKRAEGHWRAILRREVGRLTHDIGIFVRRYRSVDGLQGLGEGLDYFTRSVAGGSPHLSILVMTPFRHIVLWV